MGLYKLLVAVELMNKCVIETKEVNEESGVGLGIVM